MTKQVADPRDEFIDGPVIVSNWRRSLRRFRHHRLGIVSLGLLTLLTLGTLVGPLLLATDPLRIDLAQSLALPSRDHLLGTDESGRDVLARLMHGGRVTLLVGMAAMAISVVLGTILGALAGYFGGWLDRLIVQAVDGLLAVPVFFLWLVALASLGPTVTTIIVLIGVTSWMPTARVIRGEVARIKNREFVEAARVVGNPEWRILVRYVLPQTVPAIVVSATLATAFAILSESALSYLGVGIQPPSPSWGGMLSTAQDFVWQQPLLALYPGLLIFSTVLLFNLVGDALQAALSPRA